MARWRKAAANTNCRDRKASAIWASGLRADYPLDDEITLSLGGSWRQSNAYAFDINQTWQPSTTRGQHVSRQRDARRLERRRWNMATASPKQVAIAGLPRLGLNGTQASLGYLQSTSMRRQRRLAASGLWPQQRRVLQWRAAAEDGCGLPASESANIRAVTMIAAMPLKAGASSAALRGVTPPRA